MEAGGRLGSWLGENPGPPFIGVRKKKRRAMLCRKMKSSDTDDMTKEVFKMRKRNVTITVRCTEDERDKIRGRAEQHGLPLSDYVLRSALGKKIVVINGLDEVVRQMKAIGNNINQLARAVNEGRVYAVNFDAVHRDLYALYGQIGKLVREVK